MAFADRFAGTGVFLATEVRVQFHEWPAIAMGTMVQAILLVFIAVLNPSLLPIALVGSLALFAYVTSAETNIDAEDRYAWNDVGGWFDFYGTNTVSARAMATSSASVDSEAPALTAAQRYLTLATVVLGE